MAIDNGQAITFVEQQLRICSDLLSQIYYRAKTASDVWTAGNLGELFPATSDLVLDQNQYAHPVTSNDVLVAMGVLNGYLTDLSANNNTKLAALLKVAVNPQRG